VKLSVKKAVQMLGKQKLKANNDDNHNKQHHWDRSHTLTLTHTHIYMYI